MGTTLFVIFLYVCWRTGWEVYLKEPHPNTRGFALGYVSLLAALLVESLTASRFTDRTATFLFSVLTGMLAAYALRPAAQVRRGGKESLPTGPAFDPHKSTAHSPRNSTVQRL